ncbi:hypothetical protein PAPYR_12868 [Paratrimastix pyriformis]|uniref:Uncharacterized protein n=1 Tax=Paratrimastix pyriformis TaxID=342808 RepID=A0ABQ8U5K0_9EUKA|nr:hypothetical protein PAPYR_12868 [Paratrimastix pyriformis]
MNALFNRLCASPPACARQRAGAADQSADYFLGHLWPALPGMDPAAACAAAAAEATPTSHHRLPTKPTSPPVLTHPVVNHLPHPGARRGGERSRMYGMEWGARGEGKVI